MKTNGVDYYESILVYVYDVLYFKHTYQLIMDVMDLAYDIKDGLVVLPNIYLGAEIKKSQVKSGKSNWSILSTQYANNAIKTLEGLLKDEDRQLIKVKSAGKQLLPNVYWTGLDQINKPIPEPESCYLHFIGILHWTVELGRIDIFTEVAVI